MWPSVIEVSANFTVTGADVVTDGEHDPSNEATAINSKSSLVLRSAMSFQKTSMPAGASNRCSSERIADLDCASRPGADPAYNASVRVSACEQTKTNKRSAIALSISDMVTLTPDYIGQPSQRTITFLNTILSVYK